MAAAGPSPRDDRGRGVPERHPASVATPNRSQEANGDRCPVRQAIIGYHLDDENHWVAELACGHNQHVRHDPPWINRPWVTTPEGRQHHLGSELDCLHCDQPAVDQ
ncbi:MAG: DUF3565 domain-containing protein [Marinobacter sp.]|nr:DUF3565 domain-containing protein [Marinobacter sp.]